MTRFVSIGELISHSKDQELLAERTRFKKSASKRAQGETKMLRIVALLLTFLVLPLSASAQERTPAPEGVELYIVSPADGGTISSPVEVVFGLRGMGVAPAGVEKENTGHHHLIIDAGLPALDAPVPSDDNYRHFGGGQTQTFVELEPGTHTLQLILGDHNHIPHDPPVTSEQITITVE